MAIKPKPRPHWKARTMQSVRSHPFITWGTAASIATVFAVIVPGGAWLLGRYQTVEAAELHAKQDSQSLAVLLYGQQRIETLLLRNKLNDCAAKVGTKGSNASERDSCSQYRQEYREAEKRTQFLYEQMQKK